MRIFILVVISSLGFFVGCTHSHIAEALPETAATVSFSNHVLPIIESSCGVSTCHDSKTHQSDLVLSSYSSIHSLIGSRNPSSSILYERICTNDTSIRMPKVPELALTLSQKTIIKTWIEQGAMNTDIVKDMLDTSHISYKTDIAPIFEIHCRGCHNEYDHAGHFDATNLDHLRGYASDGTLIGVIVHDNGYQSMPRNADTLGPALLPNDISRIRSWINKGMLNN